MSTAVTRPSSIWIWLLCIGAALLAALFLVPGSPLALTSLGGASAETEAEGAHDHEHDHAHEGAIVVSAQARRSIGLRTGDVSLLDYARMISVPAIVAERPGRTHVTVAAPLTGIVTGQFVARGEAVKSGRMLFRLRLTHEDLVQVQSEFLKTLGDLDVEKREIDRLESVAAGAVPGKLLLEKQYQKEKLEVELAAERESLLLHGLSAEQIATIEKDRKLLRELVVEAPFVHEDESLHEDAETPHENYNHAAEQVFVVENLGVNTGEAVQAGQTLCVLADYSELLVEGHAFEQDAPHLVRAANEARTISAMLEGGRETELIEDLIISFVANQVDPETRALHFYASLENEIVRDAVEGERHFLTWRFKPGQRMQVRVPVETWEQVIVVPVDAVAQDGIESVVFVENGDHFDRRPVHVMHRDQVNVVIANDGSIFPGESIAMTGAHQLLMALKNQAGGPVDPHAGHNH